MVSSSSHQVNSLFAFTDTEIALLRLLSLGYSDSAISSIMLYSPSYVSCKIHRMCKKYGLCNRCHLVAIFVQSQMEQMNAV